jgi:hypothetical protein
MRILISLFAVLHILLSAIVSTTTTASAAAIAYTYDDLGRLSKVCYDGVKLITYSYDPAGNRTSIVTLGSCS